MLPTPNTTRCLFLICCTRGITNAKKTTQTIGEGDEATGEEQATKKRKTTKKESSGVEGTTGTDSIKVDGETSSSSTSNKLDLSALLQDARKAMKDSEESKSESK